MDDDPETITTDLLDLTGLNLREIMNLDSPELRESLDRMTREISRGPDIQVCGNWAEGETAPDRNAERPVF